jgi:hypothetical protein
MITASSRWKCNKESTESNPSENAVIEDAITTEEVRA